MEKRERDRINAKKAALSERQRALEESIAEQNISRVDDITHALPADYSCCLHVSFSHRVCDLNVNGILRAMRKSHTNQGKKQLNRRKSLGS